MFFSIFWVVGSAFDECLASLVQLVVRECFIDVFGGFICGAIGQTLQVAAITVGAFTFEKTLFDYRFVKVNLALLGIRAVVLWLVVFFNMGTDQMSTEGEERSCFA